jgi:GAF domain-containing protein
MKASEPGHPAGDITVRDLLSSLTALQALSMVMTDSRGEDEILNLAVAALPPLSRQCRAEAVWLDGEWRSVDCLRGGIGPRADLEGQLARLGGAGGLLHSRGLGWAWAFPLTSRGGPSGYLVVGSSGPPPEHERSLIQALAQQTGVALANARLLAQERAARARLSGEQNMLRRVAALVARAAPPEEVFTAVAAEAGRLLDADFAVISRHEADGTATAVGHWRSSGAADLLSPGSRLESSGEKVHTLVFQTGRPARIDDYGDDSGVGADIAGRWGISSVVGVPISLEGRLWGLIGVASRRQGPLPAGAEAWLAGFTELVATAIANAQARVELRQVAEEQAALRRVATLVAQAARPEEVFEAVTEEVGRLIPLDSVAMGRYESDETMTVVATSGPVGDRFAVGGRWPLGGNNVSTLVAQTGRPARIDSYGDASGSVGVAVREEGVGSGAGTPIIVEGRLWGVMTARSGPGQPLPAHTEARLASFTELLATAIANAESRARRAQLAEEQTALRRVATLVARGAPSDELFGAVIDEVGQLLRVDLASICRYEGDGTMTWVANWGRAVEHFPVGSRRMLGGKNLGTIVFETGRSARIDNYADMSSGSISVGVRDAGINSSLAAPIMVEGRLWGVIAAGSIHKQPLPADTEARLASFTELLATAIANAESRAQLTASRARIVAAADDTRQRIERDLHDGAQQQLVTLGLQLRSLASTIPAELHGLHADVGEVASGLDDVLDELRELSRGIHPAVLSTGGLGPALKTLARRAPIPVEVDVRLPARPPERIEVAIYYVIAEALTNVAKHAQASVVVIDVEALHSSIRVSVTDDGIGGADPALGSGLLGLRDRVDALDATMTVTSPPEQGTSITVHFPETSQ